MNATFDFLHAVQSNDIRLVMEYLKSDTKIIECDDDASRVLKSVKSREIMSAILTYCGDEMFKYLGRHFSILVEAIQMRKSLKIIEEIVLFNRDIVNHAVIHKRTPLGYAIKESQDINLIKFLISHNAYLNKPCWDDGKYPLHCTKKLQIIRLLIKSGADINSKCDSGNTPIMLAVINQNRTIFYEFLENGADINILGDYRQTVLHMALAVKSDKDIVWEIFNRTDNINMVDKNGKTPLCYALEERAGTCRPHYSKDFILELINKGLVINRDVFMHGIRYCPVEETIEALFNYMVLNQLKDVKWIDSNDNTVLHYAISKNYKKKLISSFLCEGAFVHLNHKGWYKRTPLTEAIYLKRDIKIIELFLCWGADPCCPDYITFGNILMNQDKVLDLLVLYGASVNLENEFIRNAMNNILYKIREADYSCNVFETYNCSLLKHIYLSNESITTCEGLFISEKFHSLVQFYNSELNKMKEINLVRGLSFYNFCLKHYKSSRYCFDISESEFIENDFEKVKILFPVLSNEIIVKIKINLKILERFDLLKKLFKLSVVSDDDSVELCSDCLYITGKYLKNIELNSLFAAAVQE